MEQEPVEVGRFGLLIQALKQPDGKVIMSVKTTNINFTEELVMACLENHLKYLKEKNFEKYKKSINEFKDG